MGKTNRQLAQCRQCGCDHAGISTQSVVEKMLWNRQRKTRMDLGREKFTQTVWEWKDEYLSHINAAQKKMGGSSMSNLA
jgi:valyl-tRNA synthetase